MKLKFLVVLLVLLLGLTYVSWGVYKLLPIPVVGKWVVVALMLVAMSSMMGLFLFRGSNISLNVEIVLYEVGTAWMIVMLYLFLAFLVLDIGNLCHLIPPTFNHESWIGTGTVAIFISGLLTYGNTRYRNKFRQELHLTTSKSLESPLKLVMVSDIHLGFHNRKAEFQRWVRLLNAENPDLILIAGDIVDNSVKPIIQQHMADDFKLLNAPIVASLGNHEYISDVQESIRFIESAGITLLRDRAINIRGINIVGRDDIMNMHRATLLSLTKDVDMSKFTILLDHQPYHLEQAQKAGIDFQFSGHTHRGQVWPISWITDSLFECAFGSYKKGNTQYYVSSGLGIWGGKFRIGTRSEYIVATIESHQKQ